MVAVTLPNNVDLDRKPRLARQLIAFQRKFKRWWDERGPSEFRSVPMYLRCPVGCDARGWAEFSYVRPEDYTWGLFQTPKSDRVITFGQNRGRSVWQAPPAEHADALLRNIRIQADAEPGSVEQSHALCRNAPSRYDLRNLYQFLLEEGRHFWAMAHILLEHFGSEGELEVERLLERCCGDRDQPRLLDAFNYQVDEWLSYFIWCFLADRDGKYQLSTAKYAGFDPLARTAGFMLLEEPLHLSIGTHGLERVIRRAANLMWIHDTENIFPFGGIPLPVVQKYLNFWAPRVFDLFGNDESSRAREQFLSGIRARPYEPYAVDSDATHKTLTVDRRLGDSLTQIAAAEIDVLNAAMRRQFIREVEKPVQRWNEFLRAAGIDMQLRLPHERFNRHVGPCKELAFDPEGNPITRELMDANAANWFPTAEDRRQVQALMQQVLSPDRYAAWLDPPSLGIGNKPVEGFHYVLLHEK